MNKTLDYILEPELQFTTHLLKSIEEQSRIVAELEEQYKQQKEKALDLESSKSVWTSYLFEKYSLNEGDRINSEGQIVRKD